LNILQVEKRTLASLWIHLLEVYVTKVYVERDIQLFEDALEKRVQVDFIKDVFFNCDIVFLARMLTNEVPDVLD
jgi:hypothetical protein